MQITISEFGDAAKKVVLTGKLDIAGAEQIGLPLATVAGSKTNIVVDMVGVEFIASIGISTSCDGRQDGCACVPQAHPARSESNGDGRAYDRWTWRFPANRAIGR